MNRFLYSIVFYLATPLLILRLLWRSIRSPAYLQRWSERFAFYSSSGSSSSRQETPVVFHAVSVGEVHAAVPLIRQLQGLNPDLTILVTTSTPTGSGRVTELLGDKVRHVYLPYDTPGAIKRFLDYFCPKVFVIMETELWPNLIHHCHTRDIKVVLANARLSGKSFSNYKKIPGLARTMLQELTRVTVQSPHDSERLLALGLSPEKVNVTGSMKFDMACDEQQIQGAKQDRQTFASRPVLVAASTRTADGVVEDEKVLAAFRILLEAYPDLLLVLVPRHPERFTRVFELAVEKGFNVARRSTDSSPAQEHQVYLGDTMGEMQYYLALADIVFVGGSLVPTGCQNIIEPAALGLPVITGPSLFNFQAVSELLLAAQAMQVIQNEQELAGAVSDLLANKEVQEAMGKAAREVVQVNQGATQKNLAIINELLEAAR